MHDKKNIASNRRATFDYEVLETFEAGIILSGCEVKSARNGRVNLKGSFVHIWNNTPWIEHMHISPYQPKNQPGYDPARRRKLLLKAKEISYLIGAGERAGYTLMPLEIITRRGLIKVKIGLCKSRKKYDKRELLKARSIQKELRRFHP